MSKPLDELNKIPLLKAALALEARVAELEALNGELESTNAALAIDLASAEGAVSEILDTPAPTVGAAPAVLHSHTLNVGGHVAIGDTEQLASNWIDKLESRRGWYVDMWGPKAEYLAKRNRQLPIEEVEPGWWRITVKEGARQADAIGSQAKRYLRDNAEIKGHKVRCAPQDSTVVCIEDACRAGGAGIVKGRSNLGILGVRTTRVKVDVLDDGTTVATFS